MEKLLYLEESKKNDVLAHAIEKRCLCIVTRHGTQGWRTYKSHLLSGDPAAGRLIIARPQDADDWTDLAGHERIGVTFRRGHKKCMFAARVHASFSRLIAGSEELEDVLELDWPEQLHELQRRVYYRVSPSGAPIRVRFWRGGVAARPDSDEGKMFWGVMQDLSAGGMRILSTDVAPDDFVEGDVVGCAFTPRRRGDALIVDAVFRHYQTEESSTVSVGLQFVGLETTERGRMTLARLARIVTDYHRAASQPRRRGIDRPRVRS